MSLFIIDTDSPSRVALRETGEVVERWLVDTRNKLHGEFANHGES